MTIREVAARAGVSPQTVCNVLNGHKAKTGVQTRQRVLRAIEDLGYLPNSYARGLRLRRSSTVLFFTVTADAGFIADPGNSAVMSGMVARLHEHGYCMLVQTARPDRVSEVFGQLYQQRRFDGAVVLLSGVPKTRRSCLKQLTATGCPLVLLDDRAPEPHCACVRTNDRQGAEQVVDYLYAQGHRQIGFLTARWPFANQEERLAGYRTALQAHGLPIARQLTVTGERVEAAETVVRAALRRGPAMSALFCVNDILAVGALQAARKAGRRVPQDLAVVGFNDFEFACFAEPPLTTVLLPKYDMGQRAADVLLGYFREGRFLEKEVILPATLVRRHSA